MAMKAAIIGAVNNPEVTGGTPEAQRLLDELRGVPPKQVAARVGGVKEEGEQKQKRGKRPKPAVDGYTFDSGEEAQRYLILRSWQEKGRIFGLRVHPEFLLREGFVHPSLGKIKPVSWVADFEYTQADSGVTVIEDYKGKYVYRSFKDKLPHIAWALRDRVVFINTRLTGWYE